MNLFKLKKEPRVLKENYVFKMDGWRFYTREVQGGDIEFWAHHTENPDSAFLGTWKKDTFNPVSEFRSLPWSLQKGGERLRRFMNGLPYGHLDW